MRALTVTVGLLALLWCVGAILFGGGQPPIEWWRWASAVLFLAATTTLLRGRFGHWTLGFVPMAAVLSVYLLTTVPSLDRSWDGQTAHQATVRWDGTRFEVQNHRAFRYSSVLEWDTV